MMIAELWRQLLYSGLLAIAAAVVVLVGYAPAKALLGRQEARYGRVLRTSLLFDVPKGAVTFLSLSSIVLLGLLVYALAEHYLGFVIGAIAGAFIPTLVIRTLKKRRTRKLEDQLVAGIQTVASSVRAGLNLIQGLQLVARDGPKPLREEFAHLVQEYEYGVPLDEAMDNAARRIDSGDFKLLFSALRTHRERGGDLGTTLDRIAESIREIQRLEKRVDTLTAQGRATARWLGMMPIIVLLILYFLVNPQGVTRLFEEDAGKLMLGLIALMNLLGFLWIRRIVAIDI